MNFLKKILPWIGAAATGNVPALVNMAANEVGKALGTKVEATTEAITAAVSGATPEQLLALKQADNEFALKMQAMGFEHEEDVLKIAAEDRANAREREIKTGDKLTPRILAAIVVCAWVTVQTVLLFHIVDQSMRELVARVLGTLDAALLLVLGYYFGSSAGSAVKNEILNKGGN